MQKTLDSTPYLFHDCAAFENNKDEFGGALCYACDNSEGVA